MNRALGATLVALALAACGGGGEGSAPVTNAPTTPNTPGTSTDVVPSTGSLKPTAGSNTYPASGREADALAALNAARAGAGAGYVSQSVALDTAAAAHAKYLTTNITAGLVHNEDASKADYYEATPSSRMSKAGFSVGIATEVIGGTGASFKGADCILGLLNTVYHGAALLSQATYVGIGFGQDAIGVPLCVANLSNLASESYTQVAPSGALIAYPYGGQAGVMETFYVAYESPRPPANLFPNTTAGTPVIVNVRNADYVNHKAAGTLGVFVHKFELKDAAGNTVAASILANSGITGSGLTLNADSNLGEGFVVLVPLSPLARGIVYTATFTATLKTGGAALSKTWSFTTNP